MALLPALLDDADELVRAAACARLSSTERGDRSHLAEPDD
jgi:hypothetical protein